MNLKIKIRRLLTVKGEILPQQREVGHSVPGQSTKINAPRPIGHCQSNAAIGRCGPRIPNRRTPSNPIRFPRFQSCPKGTAHDAEVGAV
jgi:hypothetical protein